MSRIKKCRDKKFIVSFPMSKRELMGSSQKKHKNTESMSETRNFGVPAGQVTSRDPLTATLFMKVGTRVGTITAYYQHVNSPVITPSLLAPPNSPEPPVYDVPKKVP